MTSKVIVVHILKISQDDDISFVNKWDQSISQREQSYARFLSFWHDMKF